MRSELARKTHYQLVFVKLWFLVLFSWLSAIEPLIWWSAIISDNSILRRCGLWRETKHKQAFKRLRWVNRSVDVEPFLQPIQFHLIEQVLWAWTDWTWRLFLVNFQLNFTLLEVPNYYCPTSTLDNHFSDWSAKNHQNGIFCTNLVT